MAQPSFMGELSAKRQILERKLKEAQPDYADTTAEKRHNAALGDSTSQAYTRGLADSYLTTPKPPEPLKGTAYTDSLLREAGQGSLSADSLLVKHAQLQKKLGDIENPPREATRLESLKAANDEFEAGIRYKVSRNEPLTQDERRVYDANPAKFGGAVMKPMTKRTVPDAREQFARGIGDILEIFDEHDPTRQPTRMFGLVEDEMGNPAFGSVGKPPPRELTAEEVSGLTAKREALQDSTRMAEAAQGMGFKDFNEYVAVLKDLETTRDTYDRRIDIESQNPDSTPADAIKAANAWLREQSGGQINNRTELSRHIARMTQPPER